MWHSNTLFYSQASTIPLARWQRRSSSSWLMITFSLTSLFPHSCWRLVWPGTGLMPGASGTMIQRTSSSGWGSYPKKRYSTSIITSIMHALWTNKYYVPILLLSSLSHSLRWMKRTTSEWSPCRKEATWRRCSAGSALDSRMWSRPWRQRVRKEFFFPLT